MRTTLVTAALITSVPFIGLTGVAPGQEKTHVSPSPAELAERSLHRRAVEAVIWGMPAVNYDLMLQEMLSKTGGKVNQVIYWGGPLDWHNQTLTPNPDALYFMTFFNTKDGPIVPPSRRRRIRGQKEPVKRRGLSVHRRDADDAAAIVDSRGLDEHDARIGRDQVVQVLHRRIEPGVVEDRVLADSGTDAERVPDHLVV